MKNVCKTVFITLVLIFLYAPILILTVYSFTDATTIGAIRGFSLHNYVTLFTTPEAELFAERCRALGVPSENILIEAASTNTGENFRFSRELLSERGIFPSTGIAVCKPYMAKRAWATGTKQWPEVTWSVMTQPLSLEEYGTDDITIALMVGDLQRLRVYAEKGFQAPVEVPDDIWSAYERLVAVGYDQYVIAS